MTNNLTATQEKQNLQDDIIAAYKKYIAGLIKLDMSAANPNRNNDLDNLQRDIQDLKTIAINQYGEKFFAESIEKAKLKG